MAPNSRDGLPEARRVRVPGGRVGRDAVHEGGRQRESHRDYLVRTFSAGQNSKWLRETRCLADEMMVHFAMNRDRQKGAAIRAGPGRE